MLNSVPALLQKPVVCIAVSCGTVTHTESKEVDFNFTVLHSLMVLRGAAVPFTIVSLYYVSLEMGAKSQSCYSRCHPSSEVLKIL